MKHTIALVISILIVFCLGALAADGFDEAEADRQDKEARASREWAGLVQCGPHATADWLDDKTMRCLKHVDQPPRVTGARP